MVIRSACIISCDLSSSEIRKTPCIRSFQLIFWELTPEGLVTHHMSQYLSAQALTICRKGAIMGLAPIILRSTSLTACAAFHTNHCAPQAHGQLATPSRSSVAGTYPLFAHTIITALYFVRNCRRQWPVADHIIGSLAFDIYWRSGGHNSMGLPT
jgi:hypothetical protein